MRPFILHQPEARKLHDLDEITIFRKVGSTGMHVPSASEMTPEYKGLMIQVCFYQKARLFWTQEHFRHIYDPNKHETLIQYMADGRLFPGCPLAMRLEYGKNGIYTANLQKEWMARARLEVLDVDLAYRTVVDKNNRPTCIKQWEWVVKFAKREPIAKSGVALDGKGTV